MTSTITVPKSNIPIGSLTIAGVVYDVPQHPEFARFCYDLVKRVGGVTAQTNNDLSIDIQTLDSEAQMPRSDPGAQEALRAVDELRNEFASLRSDCDSLRSQISDRDAELASLRAIADMRPRVEQLEDRLT